jgi:hypothetical protein
MVNRRIAKSHGRRRTACLPNIVSIHWEASALLFSALVRFAGALPLGPKGGFEVPTASTHTVTLGATVFVADRAEATF